MAEAIISLVFGLGFFLLAIVLAFAIPIWVYYDAKTNSPQSAVLWALIAFFGGLLGLLLYFVLGRNSRRSY